MQQNKLRQTLKQIRTSIIALGILACIATVALLITQTQKNEITPPAGSTFSSPRTSPEITPQRVINQQISQEWENSPRRVYELGNNLIAEVPTSFEEQLPAGDSPVPNTLILEKMSSENTKQSITISVEKNGNFLSVKEYLEGSLEKVKDQIQAQDNIYAEVIKDQYAATVQYVLKDQLTIVLLTTVASPPYIHQISISQNLESSENLAKTWQELYDIRNQFLQKYSLVNHDSDPINISRDQNMIKLQQKNAMFYREYKI